MKNLYLINRSLLNFVDKGVEEFDVGLLVDLLLLVAVFYVDFY